jgi:hypothetical protein
MFDNDFTREVLHRSALLTGCFNPGRAMKWVRKADNRKELLRLLEDSRKYMSGYFTPQDVSEFWGKVETSSEIKAFIKCLDAGAETLCQKGRKGDIYSVPVLHCVIYHFIQQYLRHEEAKACFAME